MIIKILLLQKTLPLERSLLRFHRPRGFCVDPGHIYILTYQAFQHLQHPFHSLVQVERYGFYGLFAGKSQQFEESQIVTGRI